MILVPVKNFSAAKQRLSSALSPEERLALAQAMCGDVLQTLAHWQERPAVAVVTSDPFARDLAARFGFDVIADNEDSSETSAIENGYGCVLRAWRGQLLSSSGKIFR